MVALGELRKHPEAMRELRKHPEVMRELRKHPECLRSANLDPYRCDANLSLSSDENESEGKGQDVRPLSEGVNTPSLSYWSASKNAQEYAPQYVHVYDRSIPTNAQPYGASASAPQYVHVY